MYYLGWYFSRVLKLGHSCWGSDNCRVTRDVYIGDDWYLFLRFTASHKLHLCVSELCLRVHAHVSACMNLYKLTWMETCGRVLHKPEHFVLLQVCCVYLVYLCMFVRQLFHS